ncbi:hypothetical protein QP150_20045 [Sphingomonas sp. 22L2VL55-3]
MSILQTASRREVAGMALGMVSAIAFPTVSCASKTVAPLRPEDFGATGRSDDTAAIQRLANYAASAGLSIDGANRTYHVDNVIWPSQTRLANIRFVLNRGDQDDRSPVAVGKKGQVTRDLIFDNVVVDGNRSEQEAVGRSGYADGARSGFQIKGAVDKVTLRNCQAVNCATDGVMIFSDLQHGTDDGHILRDITLLNVASTGNRRHGLSADSFRNLILRGCRLGDNGNDRARNVPVDHGQLGARYNGTPYGRPFDIEDYLVGTGWANFVIEDTDCRGNRTGALVYSPVSPESPGFVPRQGLKIIRCHFDELGGGRWDPPLGIAQATDYKGSKPTFRNVQLIDNIFDNGPLRVSGVENLVASGGAISVTKKNETEPFIVTNCRGVSVAVSKVTRTAVVG